MDQENKRFYNLYDTLDGREQSIVIICLHTDLRRFRGEYKQFDTRFT